MYDQRSILLMPHQLILTFNCLQPLLLVVTFTVDRLKGCIGIQVVIRPGYVVCEGCLTVLVLVLVLVLTWDMGMCVVG